MQKTKYHMIHLYEMFQRRQIYRKYSCGQSWGVGIRRTANEYKAYFWSDENALKLECGDWLHHSLDILKTRDWYTCKRVNVMVCEIYLNKIV